MISKFPSRTVSRATLKRLPLYLHFLREQFDQDLENVSSTRIAEEFGFDPTQVRKDLEVTGAVGVARIGFNVAILTEAIRDFLGWNNAHDAFLIGVGNLGKALLGYGDFAKYGLNIVAAFDSDPNKVGKKVFGVQVLSLAKLPELVKRMHINIAIIAVPAEQAQSVVDMSTRSGVKAVWNFAPAPLRIAEGVILENARFTPSLAVLTNKLTKVLKG